MFATRGQIPYSVVFESLTNLEQPKQKYYRAIKDNVNLDYIRLIVSQLLSGKEPTPRRSKRQADV
jgi:hypothetical protein